MGPGIDATFLVYLGFKVGRSNAAGSAFGENSGSFSFALIPLEAPGPLGLDRNSKVDGDRVACSPGSRPKNISALAELAYSSPLGSSMLRVTLTVRPQTMPTNRAGPSSGRLGPQPRIMITSLREAG
ncbi:hypothetical protein EMPG_09502 [Blastomyces silverae]|uniref:Uncharacterized protein n=1 Tax=Blastomyces silverae TaxID=2060906 RepID=A0A0H1BMC3_9EURO|nr:hypothetical protein EMPG_09502 [Blastomyces silverae]